MTPGRGGRGPLLRGTLPIRRSPSSYVTNKSPCTANSRVQRVYSISRNPPPLEGVRGPCGRMVACPRLLSRAAIPRHGGTFRSASEALCRDYSMPNPPLGSGKVSRLARCTGMRKTARALQGWLLVDSGPSSRAALASLRASPPRHPGTHQTTVRRSSANFHPRTAGRSRRCG
jgi:hypothetical protein